MIDDTFVQGDWVELICNDGQEFEGMLLDVQPDFVLLGINGVALGFADVKVLMHG